MKEQLTDAVQYALRRLEPKVVMQAIREGFDQVIADTPDGEQRRSLEYWRDLMNS